jgi:hypothetical protein
VPDVVEEIGEPWDAGLVADGFGGLRESTGGEPAFAGGVAAAEGGLFGHFQVEAQFFFEVAIAVREGRPEAEAPFAQLGDHAGLALLDILIDHGASSLACQMERGLM